MLKFQEEEFKLSVNLLEESSRQRATFNRVFYLEMCDHSDRLIEVDRTFVIATLHREAEREYIELTADRNSRLVGYSTSFETERLSMICGGGGGHRYISRHTFVIENPPPCAANKRLKFNYKWSAE